MNTKLNLKKQPWNKHWGYVTVINYKLNYAVNTIEHCKTFSNSQSVKITLIKILNELDAKLKNNLEIKIGRG